MATTTGSRNPQALPPTPLDLAAAEAADEAVADGASRTEARQVYERTRTADPDTDMADDESLTDLLLEIANRALKRARSRRVGFRSRTVDDLHAIATLVGEALTVAGAGPPYAVPTPAATVESAPEPATVEELEAAPNGTLAGNRVGLSWVRAADIEGDSHPWWGIGPDAIEWSSSAKLWTAGAKIMHLPPPVEVAAEPAAETQVDDSPAATA